MAIFDDGISIMWSSGSVDGLWHHEVVEVFFLNSETSDYLELEFGPEGHYLVLRFRGVVKQPIKIGMQIEFTTTINYRRKWSGIALIPWKHFPLKITHFNCCAIHGNHQDHSRQYEALFSIPKSDLEESSTPNFHQLDYFRQIDTQALKIINFYISV